VLDAADVRLRAAKGRRAHDVDEAVNGDAAAAWQPDSRPAADVPVRQRPGRRSGAAVSAVPFGRDLLADDRFDWVTFAVVQVVGAALIVGAAFGPAEHHRTLAFALAGVLGVVGVVTALRPVPGRASVGSHVSMASAWLGSIAAAVVLQPGGGPAVTLGVAVGPFLALRLPSWRHRTAHLVLASIATGVALVGGGVDQATALLLLLVVGAWWQVALGSAVVFSAAERQGRALEQLMHRDPLTGVGNRRMLDERLEQELARHRRTGESLAVFVLDLDGFKAINDVVGHAAGDRVLRTVARGLLDVVRASDVVARHGGDEFCVVAPATSPAAAVVLADQLAERVAASAAGSEPLSTSVGWATFPHDGATADRLLNAADTRLLTAKANRPELGWR
jgi:diguanylate cyclase (GGDEF)-like protein